MILKIAEQAYFEIEDAKEYYNLQQEGLGDTFKGDLKESIQSIQNFPNLYPNITNKIKRSVLHRFPYSVFYTVKEDFILILAVVHQHRKPDYWVDRLN